MARRWAAAGYPVLRFDYRGTGDSSGEQRSFEHVEQDIRCALDALFQSAPWLRGAVIFGLCDAAAAALMNCVNDARIVGLILANPWVRTPEGQAKSYVRHYYRARLFQRSFWSKVVSGEMEIRKSVAELYRSWRNSRTVGPSVGVGFVEKMRHALATYSGPVLILISDRDLTAREFQDVCNEHPGWAAASRRSGVSSVVIDDSDHTFSSRDALNRASAIALGWLQRLEGHR
jgi:exosortase A-associated hydrolase 1